MPVIFYTLAFPTETPAMVNSRIKKHVRMSLGAVGFCFLMLPGQAPLAIDFVGHRLKVTWPSTRSDTAQMINLQPKWNRAIQQFIRKTMNINYPASLTKLAIALGRSSSRPEPASLSFLNLRPESLFNSMLSLHREPTFLGVMRQAVSAVLPLSIVPGGA